MLVLRSARVYQHALFRANDPRKVSRSFRVRHARPGEALISPGCRLGATPESCEMSAVGAMAANAVRNDRNAFIDADLRIEHSGDGPLSGLTFAAKDLFDVSRVLHSAEAFDAPELRPLVTNPPPCTH